MAKTPMQQMWDAFQAEDAATFLEILQKMENTNFLSNHADPIPCQAARKGMFSILEATMTANPWCCIATDEGFRTPLHFAAMNGDLASCKMMMEKRPERVKPGMVMKQTDNSKMTPMHCAAISGNEELVCFFLDIGNGEGAECPTKDGTFLVQLACSQGMAKAVKVLCSLPSFAKTAKAQDKDGSSLLHRATVEGHSEVVVELVKSSECDTSLQDSNGWTALHLACALGHEDIIEVLKGVTDLELTDTEGKRALDLYVPEMVPEAAPRRDEASSLPEPWHQQPSVVTWTSGSNRRPNGWTNAPSVVTWRSCTVMTPQSESRQSSLTDAQNKPGLPASSAAQSTTSAALDHAVCVEPKDGGALWLLTEQLNWEPLSTAEISRVQIWAQPPEDISSFPKAPAPAVISASEMSFSSAGTSSTPDAVPSSSASEPIKATSTSLSEPPKAPETAAAETRKSSSEAFQSEHSASSSKPNAPAASHPSSAPQPSQSTIPSAPTTLSGVVPSTPPDSEADGPVAQLLTVVGAGISVLAALFLVRRLLRPRSAA